MREKKKPTTKSGESYVRSTMLLKTLEAVADEALAGDEIEQDALVACAVLARMAQREIRHDHERRGG